MLKNLILSAAVLVGLAACSKSTVSTKPIAAPVTATDTNALQIDSIPLQVGYKWTYMVQTQTQSKSSLGDYPTNYTPLTTQTYTVTLVWDTVINKVRIFRLVNTLNATLGAYYNYQSGDYGSTFSYLATDSNGFYMLGSLSQTAGNNLQDSSYLMVKYGGHVGDTWSSQSGNVYYSCTWDSTQNITTTSGIITCAKLTGTSGGYTVEQYYTAKGLFMSYEVLSQTPTPSAGSDTYIRLTTLTGTNF
jgi:hypothetical protein